MRDGIEQMGMWQNKERVRRLEYARLTAMRAEIVGQSWCRTWPVCRLALEDVMVHDSLGNAYQFKATI